MSWLGRVLDDRYEVERLLGRGGMGTVYQGVHRRLARKVAIKVLDRSAVTAAGTERFRREAKYASKIVHENVVQVFDVATTPEGDEYIVMEFVEGQDLSDALDSSGALAPARAVAIVRQILLGLDAIHAAGIVHRDIKPRNILLESRAGGEHVKIADFGIARGSDPTLTSAGYMIGTAEFMAPEQFRGGRVDQRADLYAVGVTLYTLLAGRTPFQGNTVELAGQHVFQPPDMPDVAGVSPSVIQVMMRALEKDPAKRFPDARAFLAALENESAERAPSGSTSHDVVVTANYRDSTSKPVDAPPSSTDEAPTVRENPKERKPASPEPRVAGRDRRDRGPRWRIGMLAAIVVFGAGVATFAVARSRSTRRSESPPIVIANADNKPLPNTLPQVVKISAPHDAGLVSPSDSALPQMHPPPRHSHRDTEVDILPHCQCIPTNGPDAIKLCKHSGSLACRCDRDGFSLCPEPLAKCMGREEYLVTRQVGEEALCAHRDDQRYCPDLKWNRFHTPGVEGAACSGFVVPRTGADGSSEKVAGRMNCDLCPTETTVEYQGVEGSACSGYYWKTGQQLEGTLQHCQ